MNFYSTLKSHTGTPQEVLSTPAAFSSFPPDWEVVIADVMNSTAAVTAGKHDDVNLIAAGSLIAALNVAQNRGVEVPFFFGGDGGTLVVPPQIVGEVMAALRAHRESSLQNFSLSLRLGHMAVASIKEGGHYLQIAKLSVGNGFSKPILLGDGLVHADWIIKEKFEAEGNPEPTAMLNMEGLECRWDRIKPPNSELEVVCLLIEAVDPAQQREVYRNVLLQLDLLYGAPEKRNPISIRSLKLVASFTKLRREMMVKYRRMNRGFLFNSFLRTVFGKAYFNWNLNIGGLKGRDYLQQVVSSSDTLTLDGRINTIVSGTAANRIALLEYLTAEEAAGRLIYGHFVSRESIMTCYIADRNNKHVHFVDGSMGGYTEASKELKPKAKALLAR